MTNEKRKFPRSKCVLPADLFFEEDNQRFAKRATVCDISSEGLKLIINFKNFNPASPINLKIYLPEKKLSTSLSGEVVWNTYRDNRLEVGIKINKIDQKVKEEILEWVFPFWVDVEEGKKTRKKEQKKRRKSKKKTK